ncbi:hypothetical protein A2U01_0079622, partial [Trifolium medium]|nr:hypothetical protein [Trifolium medium]
CAPRTRQWSQPHLQQARALRHPGLRVAQSPEPTQLPEALPARRANAPARRASNRSNPEISVSSFQGNHNSYNQSNLSVSCWATQA